MTCHCQDLYLWTELPLFTIEGIYHVHLNVGASVSTAYCHCGECGTLFLPVGATCNHCCPLTLVHLLKSPCIQYQWCLLIGHLFTASTPHKTAVLLNVIFVSADTDQKCQCFKWWMWSMLAWSSARHLVYAIKKHNATWPVWCGLVFLVNWGSDQKSKEPAWNTHTKA